ncbi:MAG: C-GCAxxG-C-C family protein [Fusobacteriaceae bacterium]|jgi:C_GCAxxG_C_C family probable redox protein|nr:C-GCAxxG-C-C family protein [Fusobacteriaceae bacterium]
MTKSRIDAVIQNHEKNYNCCQSIVCAYADLAGVPAKDAFRMTEGLGSGVGVYSICGAVSAMAVLAGLLNSDGNLDAPATKKSTYEIDQRLIERFRVKNGSIDCMDLKGVREGSVPLRSCKGCIVDCARLVEENLFTGRFEAYTGEEYS